MYIIEGDTAQYKCDWCGKTQEVNPKDFKLNDAPLNWWITLITKNNVIKGAHHFCCQAHIAKASTSPSIWVWENDYQNHKTR